MINQLMASISNQHTFWDTVHNILPKRKQTRNQISIEQWFEHFSRLLGKDFIQEEDNFIDDDFDDHDD
jgi:hypothetical protein